MEGASQLWPILWPSIQVSGIAVFLKKAPATKPAPKKAKANGEAK